MSLCTALATFQYQEPRASLRSKPDGSRRQESASHRYTSNTNYYAWLRHEGKLIRCSLETGGTKPRQEEAGRLQKGVESDQTGGDDELGDRITLQWNDLAAIHTGAVVGDDDEDVVQEACLACTGKKQPSAQLASFTVCSYLSALGSSGMNGSIGKGTVTGDGQENDQEGRFRGMRLLHLFHSTLDQMVPAVVRGVVLEEVELAVTGVAEGRGVAVTLQHASDGLDVFGFVAGGDAAPEPPREAGRDGLKAGNGAVSMADSAWSFCHPYGGPGSPRICPPPPNRDRCECPRAVGLGSRRRSRPAVKMPPQGET